MLNSQVYEGAGVAGGLSGLEMRVCLWGIALGQATRVGGFVPLQGAEGNLNCFSKGAGLPKTSTSGKGAEPHGAGLAAGSPEALTPKAGKLGEGDSPPEREQPGWKPGHGLEADQSEMVGDDHLVSQLDPS